MEMSKTRMRGEMMREKREHEVDKDEKGKDKEENDGIEKKT